MTNQHVVLAGDSIFDNANYVPDGPCVTAQLRTILGDKITVSMIAVDGYYASDVARSLQDLPKSATHIIVSAGGNDALRHAMELENECATMLACFEEWSTIREQFRSEYIEMLRAVTATGRHVACCTIYDSVPTVVMAERAALSLFNDVIISEATAMTLPIIDLRRVCNKDGHFSSLSPIEPSFKGGQEIVRAAQRLLNEHDFDRPATTIYW